MKEITLDFRDGRLSDNLSGTCCCILQRFRNVDRIYARGIVIMVRYSRVAGRGTPATSRWNWGRASRVMFCGWISIRVVRETSTRLSVIWTPQITYPSTGACEPESSKFECNDRLEAVVESLVQEWGLDEESSLGVDLVGDCNFCCWALRTVNLANLWIHFALAISSVV